MENYKLITYTIDFISFLIQNLGTNKINSIYLFGSVSRGEATKESDVDLFIETNSKEVEKKLEDIKYDFFNSSKFKNYWSLFDIKNDFSFSVGSLDNWPDLKRSIISDGLVLFSKYKEKFSGEIYVIFKINLKRKRNENVKIWRKLYGYKQKIGKKVYISKGYINELGGNKLTNGLFVIPIEKANIMTNNLKSHKIDYKLIQIITDMPIKF